MSANVAIEPGLRLFTSNRLETLAGKLAGVLCTPLASPMQSEVIVVRNKGMERWLKLELARRHGIAANQRFPFPEAFGNELFSRAFPALKDNAPPDRDALVWRVVKALPTLRGQPGFEKVSDYLSEPTHSKTAPDDRKRLQLASRIANLFDQYLVFRPEMMLEWDRGGENGWQAALWRDVSTGLSETHHAALWQKFRRAVEGGEATLDDLPERIAIFGVSALPPFYLDLFAALARERQVNFFLLQPSQEYWGDITSAREGERILRRHSSRAGGPFEAHLDPGNRLLASLGYLGRDFLKLILDVGDWLSDEDFTDPGEGSLLHCVQSDILHLRDRGRDADCLRIRIAAPDDSIQIHSCHSPLREMEVLQDHLLDWFQRDPTLTPRDVVVMTPDIEAYAPFVQAVFGAPEEKTRAIPYSLADRSARRESHVIESFLQILELPETRLGAPTMLASLEAAAVRDRFDLGEADLERVRDWVERVNIRWGRDERHRAALGLPALSDNTWRTGLDRLLLGYSMRSDGNTVFDGLLPFEGIEGDAAEVLGHFAEFVERTFTAVADLGQARSLEGWAETLEAILANFFQPSESAVGEFQTIRRALRQLRRQQKASGFDEPISLGVLLEHLRPALEEDRFGTGFLTGGVTFCGLKPMRSIPFRVVCLVGMNDGVFPRVIHHLSFDRMAETPRLGDRSTREDDRYLFLETLLSARERLHISYVGQSVRDNTEAPPSVLVSELLDYVEQGFVLGPVSDGRSLREHLLIKHRLQAFSEEYFHGGRLFSYSNENCSASEFNRRERAPAAIFVPRAVPNPDEEFYNVKLEDLNACLSNPARFFLNRRLGVYLPEAEAGLYDREHFVLGGLNRFHLKQELLERLCSRENLASRESIIRADGNLPPGTVGDVEFRGARARAEAFCQRLENERLLEWIEPLEVDLILGRFRLTGRIAPRTEAGPLLYRCAKLKARDVLRAWIHHLAFNASVPGGTTTLVAENEKRQFAPPPDAGIELHSLLELYERGFTEPLKFFPESALAFAQAEWELRNSGESRRGARSPVQKAVDKWRGSETPPIPGERDDLAVQRCFGDTAPFDDDFQNLARVVFEPVPRVQTREEL